MRWTGPSFQWTHIVFELLKDSDGWPKAHILQIVERMSFRTVFLPVCGGICTLAWSFLVDITAFPRIHIAANALCWNSVRQAEYREYHRKKVFELPIPRFDPAQEAHRALAALGRECARQVSDWIESGGPGDVRSIGKLRSVVRELLGEELAKIDRLVELLLSTGV